jgi:hypothetical protein
MVVHQFVYHWTTHTQETSYLIDGKQLLYSRWKDVRSFTFGHRRNLFHNLQKNNAILQQNKKIKPPVEPLDNG